jgi:arginine/ornithine transport system substrate-binding protein
VSRLAARPAPVPDNAQALQCRRSLALGPTYWKGWPVMPNLMHRLSLICATALLVLPVAAQQLKREVTSIRLGVEGAYPPFSEIGTDGKLKGFDIDIANALCAKMKLECTLVQAEFDAMIPALQAKKFDAIVASMAITPERRKVVDFTDRYYNTPARFVTKTGAAFAVTPEGLKGKRIGVQRTTVHDRYATDKWTGSEVVRYAKQDEVFLDLASGRIDGTLVDSVAADEGFLKTPAGKNFAFLGPNFNDPAYFGIGAGIAVRKGDASLQTKFNAALAAIRVNGTYKKINDKYFTFDVYGPETREK